MSDALARPAAPPPHHPSTHARSSQTAASSPRAAAPRRINSAQGRRHVDRFFEHQPTAREELPSPEPLVHNLTRAVIEVLAGARDLDQLSRWVTDEVYRHLLRRVILSARARRALGRPSSRPIFSLGTTIITEPRDGVVESVVVVHGRARVRSVALRLEGMDSRWRATAIHVL